MCWLEEVVYPFLWNEKCQGGQGTGCERLESESKKVINHVVEKVEKGELVQG